jgi:hypothetical protein
VHVVLTATEVQQSLPNNNQWSHILPRPGAGVLLSNAKSNLLVHMTHG